MPRDVLVNINFPDCAPDEVKGIAVAAQGKRDQELLRIDARHDGRGNPYYWIAFARGERRRAARRHAISPRSPSNRIAVTPLRLDMTDEPFMTKLARMCSTRSGYASPTSVVERGLQLLGLERLLQRRAVAVSARAGCARRSR